jgi:hypothetical protein
MSKLEAKEDVIADLVDRMSILEAKENTRETASQRVTRSRPGPPQAPDLTDRTADILNRLQEVETIVNQLNDCSTQPAAKTVPLTTKEFTLL